MKRATVFINVSADELSDDFNSISALIGRLNDIYQEHGLYFSVLKNSADFSDIRLISAQICHSDIMLFLVYHELSEADFRIFDAAVDSFIASGKPRIITCCKDSGHAGSSVHWLIDRLSHSADYFCCEYISKESLLYNVLLQLTLDEDSLKPVVDHGKVMLDGREVFTLSVEMAQNIERGKYRRNTELRDFSLIEQECDSHIRSASSIFGTAEMQLASIQEDVASLLKRAECLKLSGNADAADIELCYEKASDIEKEYQLEPAASYEYAVYCFDKGDLARSEMLCQRCLDIPLTDPEAEKIFSPSISKLLGMINEANNMRQETGKASNPPIRIIHIFLASSIVELDMDRDAVAAFIQALNDILIDYNVSIRLFECEYADCSIQSNGMQNSYNDEIRRPCDIFLNLYYTKPGQYTRNEFNVAYETQRKYGRPLITACFREYSGSSSDAGIVSLHDTLSALPSVTVLDYDDISLVKERLLSDIRSFLPFEFYMNNIS